MGIEKFRDSKLTGTLNVACKFDDGSVRYWSADKASVIKNIVRIVEEYMDEGYRLTLRQLHYQFVANVPGYVNHDTAYKKLGTILDDCRYGGIIDWDAIEDRGRVPHLLYWVKDIAHALKDTVDQYRLDRQKGQANHVELWSEKDALSGILSRSTEKYHIQLVINKGYTSSTAAHKAYRRFAKKISEGGKVTILYFGDHDPSGLDMVRDIKERLMFFLCRSYLIANSDKVRDWWALEGNTIYDAAEYTNNDKLVKLMEEDDDDLVAQFDAAQAQMYIEENKLFNVIHIGLTRDQVTKYKLPPNPTKMTDTRSGKYVQRFGRTCWEVDALKPQVLTALIEKHIQEEIDINLFLTVMDEEERHIKELKKVVKEYEKK